MRIVRIILARDVECGRLAIWIQFSFEESGCIVACNVIFGLASYMESRNRIVTLSCNSKSFSEIHPFPNQLSIPTL